MVLLLCCEGDLEAGGFGFRFFHGSVDLGELRFDRIKPKGRRAVDTVLDGDDGVEPPNDALAQTENRYHATPSFGRRQAQAFSTSDAIQSLRVRSAWSARLAAAR
jgi:hypothetical protein